MQTSTLNINQHYSISIKPCIPAPSLFSITWPKLRCWEQEWHHSLQKTCWKKLSNPPRARAPKQHKWKDLKAICWAPRRPQFLIGFSRATLSKALWEGGHTHLSAEEPALISVHQSHTNLSSAVAQNWQVDGWLPKKHLTFNLDSPGVGTRVGSLRQIIRGQFACDSWRLHSVAERQTPLIFANVVIWEF